MLGTAWRADHRKVGGCPPSAAKRRGTQTRIHQWEVHRRPHHQVADPPVEVRVEAGLSDTVAEDHGPGRGPAAGR
jgi:hypothetical protein